MVRLRADTLQRRRAAPPRAPLHPRNPPPAPLCLRTPRHRVGPLLPPARTRPAPRGHASPGGRRGESHGVYNPHRARHRGRRGARARRIHADRRGRVPCTRSGGRRRPRGSRTESPLRTVRSAHPRLAPPLRPRAQRQVDRPDCRERVAPGQDPFGLGPEAEARSQREPPRRRQVTPIIVNGTFSARPPPERPATGPCEETGAHGVPGGLAAPPLDCLRPTPPKPFLPRRQNLTLLPWLRAQSANSRGRTGIAWSDPSSRAASATLTSSRILRSVRPSRSSS